MKKKTFADLKNQSLQNYWILRDNKVFVLSIFFYSVICNREKKKNRLWSKFYTLIFLQIFQN